MRVGRDPVNKYHLFSFVEAIKYTLVAGPDSPDMAVRTDKDKVEPLPAGQAVGVRIDKLTKIYHAEGCTGQEDRLAVDALSFEIATPGITALLGHNGE